MISNLKFKISNSRGFTLVELVVVLSVFSIIIASVATIFVSIVQHQRRILADQEVISQVSYAKEYMSRALRSAVKDASGDCLFDGESNYPGYIYLPTHYNATTNDYEGIKFITKDNVCQEFFFDRDDGLLKEVKNGGQPLALMSDKFDIQYVIFAINGDKEMYGASQDDLIQPRVTFVLEIGGDINEGVLGKTFQTTVSQRNLNLSE